MKRGTNNMLVEQVVSTPGTLSLLHAPAGFGKSTLLAQIRERLEDRSARVSDRLDPQAEGGEPAPWIILDEPGFADVDSARIQHALDRAAASNVGIVIASRHIDRMPLARLRAGKHTVHFGPRQIGTGVQETISQLRDALDKPTAEWIAGLIAGWTVAIPFVLAHAQGPAPRFASDGEFLSSSGLSAYIDEELLAGMPADWVSALRYASILSGSNKALLDAIRPKDDLGRHLASLRNHLPGLVDDCGGITKLNPLLRMHLDRQFEQLPRADRTDALDRASRSCARVGQTVEAAGLIIRIGEPDALADFVRRSKGLLLWTIAGFDVIRDIVAQADLHGIDEPRLNLFRCTVLMKGGQIAECERLLETVLPLLAHDDDALRDAEELRTTLLIYGCRIVTDEDMARISQTRFRYGDNPSWKTLILLLQCILSLQRGELSSAAAHIVEATKQAQICNSRYNLLFLDIHAVNLALARGDLQRARMLLGRARAMWRQEFYRDVGVQTILDALTANLEFEAGRLASARVHIRRSTHEMPHVEAWLDIYAAVYEPMARILVSDIGLAGTLVTLKTQLDALEANGLPRVSRLVQLIEACIVGECLLRDRSATHRLVIPPMDEPQAVWSWQERELFAMAEAYSHLHRGDGTGAVETLQGLVAFAERQGLSRSSLRAYLLLVAALDAVGDTAAADQKFAAALKLGQQSEMARAFMEVGGEPVRRRVAASVTAFRKNRNVDLKQAKLLRSLTQWEGVKRSETLPRLTPREVEVLEAVEKGEADKRIGRRLNVTEHAVRYHLKNIYRKLGVHDRIGAVARAREAGLLASS